LIFIYTSIILIGKTNPLLANRVGPAIRGKRAKNGSKKLRKPMPCLIQVKYNSKLIKFFGVIALLIVFEFLNLLLHPFLERVSNHSPVLMLLALVCIAALLVPLHHRIEKWATNQSVEKNKQIRLAAAKKTIQELEKENS
jgi:NADH:ubiquinone oxidoreductase subunit 3 (subunit A)